MRLLKNILSIIGALTVLLGLVVGITVGKTLSEFDPQMVETYARMTRQLLATGNAAEATVWKVKVKPGVKFEEVEQSIKSIANELNIRSVGELPLGDQIGAMTGKPWRKLTIYLYCNPLTAAKMIDYSDAYAAYLPCRISLLEDKTGQLWIYTLDMDMMIHGGKPLPEDLKQEALKVKKVMLAILDRGAKGDF